MEEGLLALIDANAWTFGPVSTALRILELTLRRKQNIREAWQPLLEGCKRMNPLGLWLREIQAGKLAAEHIAADLMRRESLLLERTLKLLGPSRRVLLVGHDHEIPFLLTLDGSDRRYRHLLLEGPPAIESPGQGVTDSAGRMESPLPFSQLEESLDWADGVLLSGFLVHSCNVLGPAQLRPFLMSARDQVDRMLLLLPRERNFALGGGHMQPYSEDFRPCWWNHSITHLIEDHAQ